MKIPHSPVVKGSFKLAETDSMERVSVLRNNVIEKSSAGVYLPPKRFFRFRRKENMQKRLIYGIMLTMLACLSVFAFSVHRVQAVELVGDINGDGKVDVKDVYAAGLAFGAKTGESRWDSKADLNGNGKVDLADVFVICEHFGETT